MTFYRKCRLWCIVKAAKMLDAPDGMEMTVIPFGRSVVTNSSVKPVNGMIRVTYYDPGIATKDVNPTVTGWVNENGFTDEPVEDYAKLYYRNFMGKRVPVSMRFHGKRDGWIQPGERVAMIARVGDWCLTSRGWSKWDWFEKCRLGDPEDYANLAYAVLKQAVYDYEHAIERLKKKKYRGRESFLRIMWEIDKIEQFFTGRYFSKMYGDLNGKERLKDLKRELKVDDAWLKRMKKEMTDLESKGWLRGM